MKHWFTFAFGWRASGADIIEKCIMLWLGGGR